MATDDWQEEHTRPEEVGVISSWRSRKGFGFIEPKPVDGQKVDKVFAHKERFKRQADRDYASRHGVYEGTEVAYKLAYVAKKNLYEARQIRFFRANYHNWSVD